MCFSVEVQKEINTTAFRFNAQVPMTDIDYFMALRSRAENTEWTKQVLNLSRKPMTNILSYLTAMKKKNLFFILLRLLQIIHLKKLHQ